MKTREAERQKISETERQTATSLGDCLKLNVLVQIGATDVFNQTYILSTVTHSIKGSFAPLEENSYRHYSTVLQPKGSGLVNYDRELQPVHI